VSTLEMKISLCIVSPEHEERSDGASELNQYRLMVQGRGSLQSKKERTEFSVEHVVIRVMCLETGDGIGDQAFIWRILGSVAKKALLW